MLIRTQAGGFSLIECMITLAIFFILTLMAMPSFTAVLHDAQIRSTAQSITSGLQLARAEAIRRNTNVRFRLPNTLDGASVRGGTDWQIEADDGSMSAAANYTILVDRRNGKEGSQNARVGIKNANDFTAPAAASSTATDIVFTALGRVSTASRQIDVVHVTNAAARRLSITLSVGGQARLCDPALPVSANPQGCA